MKKKKVGTIKKKTIWQDKDEKIKGGHKISVYIQYTDLT